MNLKQAAETFLARQARSQHPAGNFDNAGRWSATGSERQACCNAVRSPSRAFPYSEMTHCRTAKHIAHLTGQDEHAIVKAAHEIERAAQREHQSTVSVVKLDYDF